MFKKLNDMITGMYVKAQCKAHDFFTKEDGDVNIVSIVVIIGIVILLAVVFKDAIAKLLGELFETIGEKGGQVVSNDVGSVY